MPDAIQYCDKCSRLIRPTEIPNAVITGAIVVCPDCVASLTDNEREQLLGRAAPAKPRERRMSTRRHAPVTDAPPQEEMPKKKTGLVLGLSMTIGILAGLAVALMAVSGKQDDGPERVVSPPPIGAVPVPPPVSPKPPTTDPRSDRTRPDETPRPGEFTPSERRIREVRMLIDDKLTRYASAKEALQKFLVEFPDAPEAEEAKRLQKEIAEKHLRLGDVAFLAGTESAYAQCARGDYDKALATLQNVAATYDGSDWAAARGTGLLEKMLKKIDGRRESDADRALSRTDDAIDRQDYAAARALLANTSQWLGDDRARAKRLLARLGELERALAEERRQAAAWAGLLKKLHEAGRTSAAAANDIVEAGRASITLPAYRDKLARVETRIRSARTIESLALDNLGASRRVVRLKWKGKPVAGKVKSIDGRVIVLKPVLGDAKRIPLDEIDPTDVGRASSLLRGEMAAPAKVAGYYFLRGSLDDARKIVADLHSPAARALLEDIEEMLEAIAPPPVAAPAAQGPNATTAGDARVGPALVAHWKFDDRNPERATDSTASGNHGELVGVTYVDDGAGGAAAHFDGAGEIKIPDSDSLKPDHITVAAWIRMDKTPLEMKSEYPGIVVKQLWDARTGYLFGSVYTDRNSISLRVLGNGLHRDAEYPEARTGTWFHVTGTFDGRKIRIYRDGALADEEAAEDIRIAHGTGGVHLGGGLEGDLDDLRIYRRALSAGEIAALASPGRRPTAKAAGDAATPEATTEEVAGNMVLNGGFERAMIGWRWHINGGALAGQITDQKTVHGGKRSMRIESRSPQKKNTRGRLEQVIKDIKPNTDYRLSYWCKGKDVGAVFVGGGPEWRVRSHVPRGTFDWREKTIEFTTRDTTEEFPLVVVVESTTGSVWIDDVTLLPTR